MLLTTSPAAGAPLYAVASAPAPVFSSSDVGTLSGRHVQLDSCGQPRELQFIALPGTVFTITEEIIKQGEKVFKVTTGEYPYRSPKGYYVHEKHVRTTDIKPPERVKILPAVSDIIERLTSAAGTPYLWGSNLREGLPSFSNLSSQGPGSLIGIDCSGLLYEATNGYTSRNTSALISYGEAVPVAGKSPDEIVKKLRPLDLIVWRGHVLIVLDGSRIIESGLRCGAPGNGGVKTSPLRERIRYIMKNKKPSNSISGDRTFVVRRWLTPPHVGKTGSQR